MKHKQHYLLALFLLCITGTAMSQDVILKKDNSTIVSKVLEITNTEIKYKKWSNQDGPTYSISRSEVTSINYQNGDVDRFSDNVVTSHVPQQSVTYQQPKAQIAQEQPKPEKPKSPYSRSRVQFSLNGGVALPMGKFGITDNDQYCVPFSLFTQNTSETGFGAAKTGVSAAMKLHIPLFDSGQNFVGLPIKINFLYNGITDSEKQAYKPIWEDYMSQVLNEEYGLNGFLLNITDFSKYLNFAAMIGLDYTYYVSKPFALFLETDIGLNINHITPTKMTNRLGGTPIPAYATYSMRELYVKYETKASFAYEIGGGILLFDHLSLGVFYNYCMPVQVVYNVTGFNMADEEGMPTQKLQVSALSIQLGVHF